MALLSGRLYELRAKKEARGGALVVVMGRLAPRKPPSSNCFWSRATLRRPEGQRILRGVGHWELWGKPSAPAGLSRLGLNDHRRLCNVEDA